MRADDFECPQVDLWPENWEPIHLFRRFSTQWRMGFNGPIGLDYAVIQHDLSRRNLSTDDYDKMMAAIRIIEAAALTELRKDG